MSRATDTYELIDDDSEDGCSYDDDYDHSLYTSDDRVKRRSQETPEYVFFRDTETDS